MDKASSRKIQLYTVQDLQTALETLGIPGAQSVKTISPGVEKHEWRMEPLEVRKWQGGLLIYPWTQDAIAGALIHDAEYQMTVIRQKELDQLIALAGKYGYSLVLSNIQDSIDWAQNDTQLVVPTRLT